MHVILGGFPAGATAADAELATVAAADELAQGSLEAAERYLRLAERGLEGPESVPAGRRGQARLLLGVVRLLLALRLAQDDPNAAAVALASVLDGSVPVPRFTWLAHAFMLEATARDALGDPAAAERAVERALDLAGPGGALSAFLLYPAPRLLERHARHSTRHAGLISAILDLLSGEPRRVWGAGSPPRIGGVLGGSGFRPPG